MSNTQRTVTLIGSDGSENQLLTTGAPFAMSTQAQLWGRSPSAVISRRRGTIPGEAKEGTRPVAKLFAIPLLLKAGTELEVDQRLAEFGPMLDPAVDNRIIYARPDGTTREITATYVGGAEALHVRYYSDQYVRIDLQFKAMFPYWRSVAADIKTVSGTFNDGRLSGSNDLTITNAGDVTAWPEIRIDGYAEAIEGLSMSVGKVFRIKEIIDTGQLLRIDTDPRSFGIWIDDQFAHYARDSITDFWELPPGDSRILLRANTDGVATIGTFEIRWRELHETP